MGFDEWKTVETIGRGSFGTVYKIMRENHGYKQYAAMKEIYIGGEKGFIFDETGCDDTYAYNQSIIDDILAEVETMDKVKGNTNIVSYEDHEVVNSGDGGKIIRIRMELLTPLREYLKGKTLTTEEKLKIGKDICNALTICEKYGIIHRDVKVENIFVNAAGDFKLGDFGTAKVLNDVQTHFTSAGTFSYMAPEVMVGDSYDCRVDQYSLGILMYYLFNYYEMPQKEGGEIKNPPANCPEDIADAILKACSKNKEDRFEHIADFGKALSGEIEVKKKKGSGKKTGLIIGAAAVIVVLTAVIVALLAHNKKPEIQDIETEPDTEETVQLSTENTTIDYRIGIALLPDIKPGETDSKWMEESFGEPVYYQQVNDSIAAVYMSEVYYISAVYDSDEILRAFLVTNTYNEKGVMLTASDNGRTFKLGDKTFYDLEGAPEFCKVYSDDIYNTDTYVEAYSAGGEDSTELQLFSHADIGVDVGVPDCKEATGVIDDEVTVEEGSKTLIFRKLAGPNSFGKADSPEACDMLFDREYFAYDKGDLLLSKKRSKAQAKEQDNLITFTTEESTTSLQDYLNGSFADGIYTNEFANIKIKVPAGYRACSETELFNLNKSNNVELFKFAMYPEDSNSEPYEKGIVIAIEEIPGYTEEQYKDDVITYLKNVCGCEASSVKTVVINGDEYQCIYGSKQVGLFTWEKEDAVKAYFRQSNDYFIFILMAGEVMERNDLLR